MKSTSFLRILGIAILLSGILIATLTATSQAGDKVTICHFTGLDTTEHYVAITISVNAENKHLDSFGTPLAGHELDYYGIGWCGTW